MTIFAFSKTEVVKYIAMAQLCRSLLAFMTYVSYIKFNLGKIINNRIISIVSLGGLLAFHLVTYSWPFLPGKIKMYTEEGRVSCFGLYFNSRNFRSAKLQFHGDYWL